LAGAGFSANPVSHYRATLRQLPPFDLLLEALRAARRERKRKRERERERERKREWGGEAGREKKKRKAAQRVIPANILRVFRSFFQIDA